MYDVSIVTEKITKDKILSLISELDIYSYYIGSKVKINTPISSPFRIDNNPSWSLYYSKKGELMYKDFATGESGNVFKFVQKLFNINYYQCLDKIWFDLIKSVYGKSKHNTVKNKQLKTKTTIQVKRKNFTKNDDLYWEKYGIDRTTLKKYKVYPIEKYWINEKEGSYVYTKDSPMYAFEIFNKYKIYRPLETKRENKWRSNCGVYDIQGFEQLKEKDDLLIITKSLKDVMVLYSLGYNAVAPQSENVLIPEIVIENLKNRFNRILIFYDNDESGINGANKLSEIFNFEVIYIPTHYNFIYSVKDISDFYASFGKNKTIKLLKELINEKKESNK